MGKAEGTWKKDERYIVDYKFEPVNQVSYGKQIPNLEWKFTITVKKCVSPYDEEIESGELYIDGLRAGRLFSGKWELGKPVTGKISFPFEHRTYNSPGRHDEQITVTIKYYSKAAGQELTPHFEFKLPYEVTPLPKTIHIKFDRAEHDKEVGWVVYVDIVNAGEFGYSEAVRLIESVEIDGVRPDYMVTAENKIRCYNFELPPGTYTLKAVWNDKKIYRTEADCEVEIPAYGTKAEFVSIDVPEAWPPHTSFPVRFEVKNAGNYRSTIGVWGEYDSNKLPIKKRELEPGDSFTGSYSIPIGDKEVKLVLYAGHGGVAGNKFTDETREFTIKPEVKPIRVKLYGYIRDARSLRPIANAEVRAVAANVEELRTYSKDDGYYELRLLSGRVYELFEVTAAGYEKYRDVTGIYITRDTRRDVNLKPAVSPEPVFRVSLSAPDRAVPGSPVRVNFTVKNIGGADGICRAYCYYDDKHLVIDSPHIKAGGSKVYNPTFTMPENRVKVVGEVWDPTATHLYDRSEKVIEPEEVVEEGLLHGYVYDAKTGKIIQGVRIVVGKYEVYTDDKGYYSLKLPPGSYELVAEKDGYEEYKWKFSIKAGEELRKDITLKPVVAPPPPPPPKYPKADIVELVAPDSASAGDSVTVSYTIHNAGDAEGMIWVDMAADDISLASYREKLAPCRKDSRTATFTMPNKTVKIIAAAGHYEDDKKIEDDRVEKVVELKAPPPPPEKAILQGSVVDYETSEPIPHASVCLNSICKYTDESGAFKLEVDAGSYYLIAGAPGYMGYRETITLKAGEVKEITIRLKRAVTPPPEKGVLELVVIDARTKAAVPAATIKIDEGVYSTDENGYARITLDPGSYKVAVSKDGYKEWSDVVTIKGGETKRLTIELEPTAPPPPPAPPPPAIPTELIIAGLAIAGAIIAGGLAYYYYKKRSSSASG